jgi:hypothetical protein
MCAKIEKAHGFIFNVTSFWDKGFNYQEIS